MFVFSFVVAREHCSVPFAFYSRLVTWTAQNKRKIMRQNRERKKEERDFLAAFFPPLDFQLFTDIWWKQIIILEQQ